MTRIHKIVWIVFPILFLLSCNDNSEKTYTIGFSQCMMDDVWRQAMMVEMNIELSNIDVKF